MAVNVENEFQSPERLHVVYDYKFLANLLLINAIGLMAVFFTYMHVKFGSTIYIQATMVLFCILCVIGLLKFLFQLLIHCIRNTSADNPECYLKIELAGWFLYFTINGPIVPLSLYGYHHPFVALGVGDFFYLFFMWVCGALFVLGLLKLFLDYFIEHTSRLIRVCLARDHPARNHPKRIRQLCENMINWFFSLIICGFLAFVTWQNGQILNASGDYPLTTRILLGLAWVFSALFFCGFIPIIWNLGGGRTKWRHEDNESPPRMRRTSIFIVPLRLYSYRPFPTKTRRLPKRTQHSRSLSTVTETVEMQEEPTEGGVRRVFVEPRKQETPAGTTGTTHAIIENQAEDEVTFEALPSAMPPEREEPPSEQQPRTSQPDEEEVNIEPQPSTSQPDEEVVNIEPQPSTSGPEIMKATPEQMLTQRQRMIQKRKDLFASMVTVTPTDHPH